MRKPLVRFGLIASLLPLNVLAQASSAAPAPANIEPVFDCYHINFAWGFSLQGQFVARDGTVYTYTKPKKPWMAHDIVEGDASYLTDVDLQAKIVERKQTGSIDAATMAAKIALIDAAAKGRIVHADGGARDAGSSSCHAYVHDAAKARYRDINLGSDGGVNDVRVRNDASQAQALLLWLRTLGAAR